LNDNDIEETLVQGPESLDRVNQNVEEVNPQTILLNDDDDIEETLVQVPESLDRVHQNVEEATPQILPRPHRIIRRPDRFNT
jgi:hypothetical protein